MSRRILYQRADRSTFLQEELRRRWAAASPTKERLRLLQEVRNDSYLPNVVLDAAIGDGDSALGDWVVENEILLSAEQESRLIAQDPTGYRRAALLERQLLLSRDRETFPALSRMEKDAFVLNRHLVGQAEFLGRLFDLSDQTLRLSPNERLELILLFLQNPALRAAPARTEVHETITEEVRGAVMVDDALENAERLRAGNTIFDRVMAWQTEGSLRNEVIARVPAADATKAAAYAALREAGDVEGRRHLLMNCGRRDLETLRLAKDDPDEECRRRAIFHLRSATGKDRFVDPEALKGHRTWLDRVKTKEKSIWQSLNAGLLLNIATYFLIVFVFQFYWNNFSTSILQARSISLPEAFLILLVARVLWPGDRALQRIQEQLLGMTRGLILIYADMRWLASLPVARRDPNQPSIFGDRWDESVRPLGEVTLAASLKEKMGEFMVRDHTELPAGGYGSLKDVLLSKTIPVLCALGAGYGLRWWPW